MWKSEEWNFKFLVLDVLGASEETQAAPWGHSRVNGNPDLPLLSALAIQKRRLNGFCEGIRVYPITVYVVCLLTSLVGLVGGLEFISPKKKRNETHNH